MVWIATSELQWGRRQTSTERVARKRDVAPDTVLQWGRRQTSTERTISLSLLLCACVASMGPPTNVDGEPLAATEYGDDP